MEATVEQDDIWGSIWQCLPDDLIIHIFSFLDCYSLISASETCRQWRRVALDESLWKDLVGNKVHLPRASLPGCQSWYDEYKRLCMNVPMIESEILMEHVDEVYHVLFSPSGRYFSTTGKDGYVIVWELGEPSRLFTKRRVVEPPSYTRFSEFNQSETKLLVAGMDMEYLFDGFIMIYEFEKELTELCKVRVEFPNFRGAWFDDNTFLSMMRIEDEEHGYCLQVCAHKAKKKVCQHEFSELTRIRHVCHRNDFIRVVDKTKWLKSQGQEDEQMTCETQSDSSAEKMETENLEDGEDGSVDMCDKCVVLSQTSVDHKCALYQYNVNSEALETEEHGFVCPGILYESDATIIGTNLSSDHRFLVYNVRQKVQSRTFSMYNQNIEVRVYDLQNDVDTGEIYNGAQACGEDHVSYIFPAISKDFIACGSENLKGYIWDRRFGILLSELNHECGVHSQNGVNATAFCPTDQEILVTVADDLFVRVWRSKQKLMDLRLQGKVRVRNEDNTQGETVEEDAGPSSTQQNNMFSSLKFDFVEEVTGEVDDKKVMCCYGFKHKLRRSKKSEKEKQSNMAVVNITL